MSATTHSLWNTHLMRQIIDSVTDGIFIIDPNGLVSFWNPSMEAISGYSANETMGKPCEFFICPKCGKNLLKEADNDCDFHASTSASAVECILAHKSGTRVSVIKKSSQVSDDMGVYLGTVEAVTDISELKKANQKVREVAEQLQRFQGMNQIIGKSREIQKVFAAIKAAAASDATILIQGESGTGKELVANAIHQNSDRHQRPFITVNCSALSESLLESELFGHVKGAYTGAIKDRIGRFEEAEGGTIFLDEIGELSPYIQVKLLRVIQEREVERVGESRKRNVNIRIITATHRDLLGMVVDGTFREDLYYRLKVFPIHLPPLRNRKEDIPLLVSEFISIMVKKTGKNIQELSPSAIKALREYHWPGNVRELENAIEHGFVLCQEQTIALADLPGEIIQSSTGQGVALAPVTFAITRPLSEMDAHSHRHRYQTLFETDPKYQLKEPEVENEPARPQPKPRGRKPKITREELLHLLDQYAWNKKEVGRQVGVSHTAIWKYMKKWDIPLKKP